jgi:acyl dehydratase
MQFSRERLLAWRFEDIELDYGVKDVILYALGLGFGFRPTDPDELKYVYENGLQVFPTMAVVLGHPGPWMSDPATGIDMLKVLHAEQRIEIHRPLPVAATLIARNRVVDVIDKGAGKGALICMERTLSDKASGELLCTQFSAALARANGGFGGPASGSPAPAPIPDREPDACIDLPVSPQAALLYRLNGDYNVLHADPAVALRAGFKAPILHGLASYGMAARAVLAACGSGNRLSLREIGLRFSAPVYPGETLQTRIWKNGSDVRFRSLVVARDTVVLNNGFASLAQEA